MDGFQRAHDMIITLADRGTVVRLKHIPGHKGILGNIHADTLAKLGARMPEHMDEKFDCENLDVMIEEMLENETDDWGQKGKEFSIHRDEYSVAQQVQRRSADKKRIAAALIKGGDWVLLREAKKGSLPH
jgi:hypothetical protein